MNKLEEESKLKLQQSLAQTSKSLDKDQELIVEISKVRSQLNSYKELESDMRLHFGIGEKEDINEKLVEIY